MRSKNLSIAVYHDLGTTPLGVRQLVSCLRRVFTSATVMTVGGTDVIENNLKRFDLFCVGGGYSRGLMQSMTQVGMRNLREYVEEGGHYLGVGSGAYFASKLIKFDVGGPLEAIKKGLLNFYSGIAQGPVFPGYAYNSEAGSFAAEVKTNNTSHTIQPDNFTTYFNGGCEFIDQPNPKNTILYRYQSLDTPAIVQCQVGRGQALLSGVHFEFNPWNLAELANDTDHQRILPRLKASDTERQQFCSIALHRLLNMS